MISAHELRIGNWVEANSPFMTVSVINKHDVSLYMPNSEADCFDYNIEDLQPIPLTPEILLACGFLLEENKVRFGKSYSTGGEWITFSMMEHNKGFWIIINTAHNEGINVGTTTSLHQLQNLYFALTGTELNFSPELLKPTNA